MSYSTSTRDWANGFLIIGGLLMIPGVGVFFAAGGGITIPSLPVFCFCWPVDRFAPNLSLRRA